MIGTVLLRLGHWLDVLRIGGKCCRITVGSVDSEVAGIASGRRWVTMVRNMVQNIH